MATQWPTVKLAVLNLLPTLAGWPSSSMTFNGPPVSGESGNYVTVGYVDGEVGGGSFSCDSTDMYLTAEKGTVRCELVFWAGDADITSRETEAFAAMDALDAALRADQNLGVLPQGSNTNLSVEIIPEQTTAGAVQRLRFSIDYFTRT